jgi:flagella basal body P-ring formation protein FlgA
MKLLALLFAIASGSGETEPAPLLPAPKELLVVLRPSAEVRHTPVVLADVADLNGPGDAVVRARSLELGPAPLAGKPRRVTPAGILLAARLAGLELDRRRIVGAPDVEVSANWHELASDTVVEAAEKHVQKETSQLGDRVVLERVSHPDAVPLLDGGGETTFACSLVGKATNGQAQVKVSVFQGATLVGERVVLLKVRRFGHQLRLLTDVRQGETVTAEQVIVIDGEWTNLAGVPVVDAAELAGHVARRDLAAGAVLVREAFEAPQIVDRGGSVRCVLRDGALEIVLNCIAQRPGRRGETIPVVNPTTQKTLQVELIERRPTGEVVARVK